MSVGCYLQVIRSHLLMVTEKRPPFDIICAKLPPPPEVKIFSPKIKKSKWANQPIQVVVSNQSETNDYYQ